MACKMCLERGKIWQGSDPVCFFDNDEHNWNCATINAIRDICDDWFGDWLSWFTKESSRGGLPRGVARLHYEDMSYGLISLCDIKGFVDLQPPNDENIPECLYVQWYKRHGATEAVLLLGKGIARKPTEEELLAIIDHFNELASENK